MPPGGLKVYKWYAGEVDAVPDTSTAATNDYNLVATPIEFGATGLLPADRIKGSNKGLVGALIIEPQGSTWMEDPASRASATVTKSNGSKFRDFVIIMQNDLSLRYTADNVTCTPALANLFCAVPNIHAEGGFVPEDPHAPVPGPGFHFQHLSRFQFCQPGMRKIKRHGNSRHTVQREPFVGDPEVWPKGKTARLQLTRELSVAVNRSRTASARRTTCA